MEDRFDKKIDMLFAVLNKSCATTGSSTVAEISQSGGLATQREQSSDNVPSTGERRPVISLNANLDEDLGSPRIIRNIDFDNRSEISLHIDSREKADLLGLCSSEDEYSRGLGSPVSVYSQAGNKSRNVERFSQYLQTQPTIINNNVESQSNQRQTSNIDNNNNKTVDKQSDNLNLLSKLFKEDIPSESSDNSGGLIIDEAQVRILERSWRTKIQRNLLLLKMNTVVVFRLMINLKAFASTSLDDLLEPIIRTVHGTNSVKSWDKHKQLVTQPLKQIENLAYQGRWLHIGKNKAPRYSSNNSSTHVNYNNANSADKRSGFNYNKSSVRSVPRKFQKDNKADDFGKKDKEKKAGGNWNSFP
ncbi:unnamed protein product [Mytilus edulis]|uniref:Uncharacterized protein n=1 Tax=Mytilus edulis TaxID=6550 RepID=A0A8S3VIT6_MYTED|nr:unnamed protein product [Mytilus edulis]